MHPCIEDTCNSPAMERKGARGRQPMRCAKHKALALTRQRDSATATCTIGGCDKAHRAKGLCATHYNSASPNTHRKVTLTCDGCSKPVIKEARTHRYRTVQCDDWVCRHWLTWGTGWAEKLPTYHISKWIGQSCTYVPPRTSRELDCDWCGKSIVTTVQAQRYCTRDCKTRAAKAARRGLEHNATGTYSWTEIAKLWATFDKACAYCRTPTPLTDIQAEHVEALSRGGANNLSNLLPSCGPCNSDKRELTLTAWATDRARRKLPTVTTTWSSGDKRYAHLSAPRTPVRIAA